MHPFVELMRHYCVDYTMSHDQSWYPYVFDDAYRLMTGGAEYLRHSSYDSAAKQHFDSAPGLGLTVHELVLSDDSLCMHFSEHAAMTAPHGGRALACWGGIGLYKWDGTRLTETLLEQDFQGRREQVVGGVPRTLQAPHLDPWMSSRPVASDPSALAAARLFIERGDLHGAASVEIDGSTNGRGLTLDEPLDVQINDIFSAGARVAAHATYSGRYRGGLPGMDEDFYGRRVQLHVAALMVVDEMGQVTEVKAISSRASVAHALRRPA